jgi:hypothetical protein
MRGIVLRLPIALFLLSGYESDRDQRFAECRLQYDLSKTETCMESKGYVWDKVCANQRVSVNMPLYDIEKMCYVPNSAIGKLFWEPSWKK